MTVGIDLGTTNSLIGFWRDGAVTLVPNSLWRAHAVRRRDQRPAPKPAARMKLAAGYRCPAEDPELLVFLELLLCVSARGIRRARGCRPRFTRSPHRREMTIVRLGA